MGWILPGIVTAMAVTMAGTAMWIHTQNLGIHTRLQEIRADTAALEIEHQKRSAELARIKAIAARKPRPQHGATAAPAPADTNPVLYPEDVCVRETDADVVQLNRALQGHLLRAHELRKQANDSVPPNPFATAGLDAEISTKISAGPISAKSLLADAARRKTPQGGLYQFTYQLPKFTSVPNIEEYWYPVIDRGCNTDYARIVGEDPMIAYGDTSSCKAIDVVWQREQDNRCLVLFRQPCQWHNWKYDDPLKDETFGASTAYSAKVGPDGELEIPDSVPQFAGYPGIPWRDNFVPQFLKLKLKMVEELIRVIGASSQSPLSENLGGEPIVVMNTNHGHVGLVINFFCYLRKIGVAAPKHVVFTTDAALRDRLVALGITAFYHKGLGKYPKTASAAYGDMDFGKQMNMKQFCVYLTLLTGHDVLFQDVDVMWIRDPVPGLRAQSVFHHIQIMDDGARTYRFSPLFANSGFFYIRNHPTSIRFWDLVTMHMAFGQTGNQEVLNPVMDYYTKRRGLRPRILPQSIYMSGMHISPKGKSTMFIPNRTEVIHFCWTHNFDSKLEKMSAFKKQILSDTCIRNINKCKFRTDGTAPFTDDPDVSNTKAADVAGWIDRCDAL